MSADNWGVCPKCKKLAEGSLEKYGQVSRDEYMKILEKQFQIKRNPSLREDYEIFIDEHGDFYVTYSASCFECGFKFDFKTKVSALEKRS